MDETPTRSSGFSEVEYDAFTEMVREDWTTEHSPGEEFDVTLTHSNGREILINTARNRISYRDGETGDWGIRQQKVNDIESVVETLMTVALNVDMNEMHYLGLENPPGKPDDVDY